MLVSGCAHNTGCAWVDPIYMQPSDLAAIGKPLLRQIVTHDETWKKSQERHWWEFWD